MAKKTTKTPKDDTKPLSLATATSSAAVSNSSRSTNNSSTPKKAVAGAISKTKAQAMRRKPTPVTIAATIATMSSKGGSSSSSNRKSSPHQAILAHLMEQHLLHKDDGGDDQRDHSLEEQNESGFMTGLSFAAIMDSLAMNDRNTGWRNAWKDLYNRGLTKQEPGSAGGFFTCKFCLTEAGMEAATTDELKQAMAAMVKSKPKTNEEHHKRIKGKLMNERGEQIFDLLLQNHESGSGPISRTELAAKLGISDRGAYFSYAFKQLKELGYVEDVSATNGGRRKKVQLTSKCFLFPVKIGQQK